MFIPPSMICMYPFGSVHADSRISILLLIVLHTFASDDLGTNRFVASFEFHLGANVGSKTATENMMSSVSLLPSTSLCSSCCCSFSSLLVHFLVVTMVSDVNSEGRLSYQDD